MKYWLAIVAIFTMLITPTLAQEEASVCASPFLSEAPESDLILSVNEAYVDAEIFANRIRFEQAYNTIKFDIRVTQINTMASENDLDVSAFIAQDPLIRQINAENNDVALLPNRVLSELGGDAVVWAYAQDNNLLVSEALLDATIADFFDFADMSDEEQEIVYNDFVQRIILNGTPISEIETFFCRQTLYNWVQAAVIGTIETTLYVDVNHILVSSQEVALDIITLIETGDDFTTLAQDLSLDVASGDNGGSLGWQPVIFFVPEFANAIEIGEVGTILAPVQTEFGWHVIRINAREERSVDETLREQIINSEFTAWRTEQLANAAVTINPDWINFVPELIMPKVKVSLI